MLQQSGLCSTATWLRRSSAPLLLHVHLPAWYRPREPVQRPPHPSSHLLLLSFFFDTEMGGLGPRLQVVLRILQGLGVAGVDLLVTVEGLFVAEVLPADGALVGGLPEVSEVLPAVGAGQRPVALPRVELLVQDEAHLQAEALLALGAGVGSLHHVVHLVPDDAILESR
ncbi:hypothetical protein M959_12182, partial [Chaetura pelagica]